MEDGSDEDDSADLTGSQIGDLGELAFRERCILQGLQCASLQPDRTGKDFLVEWPFDATGTVSFDKRFPARRCVVQIKSTAQERPRVRLKLSAAERLAKDDTPAFVVAPVFREAQVNHFLVFHIHGDLLSLILRRLREAQRDSRSLAKLSVELPIESGELLSLSNDSVRRYFEREIDADLLRYGQAKASERDKAGYSGPPTVTMPITFDVSDLSQITDFLLGNRELDAVIGQAEESRFDIKLSVNDTQLPQGKVRLSIDPEKSEHWIVEAIEKGGNKIAKIDGTGKSAVLRGLPPHLWRSEFDTGFISIELSALRLKVSFAGPEAWEIDTELSKIIDNVRLWRAIVVENAQLAISRLPSGIPMIIKPNPSERDRHDEWTKLFLRQLGDAKDLLEICNVRDLVTSARAIWDFRDDIQMALRKMSPRQDAERAIGYSMPAADGLLELLARGPRQTMLMTMPVSMPPATLAIAVNYEVEMSHSADQIRVVSVARAPVMGRLLTIDNEIPDYDVFIGEALRRANPTFHSSYPLLSTAQAGNQ